MKILLYLLLFVWSCLPATVWADVERVRVATYNVENYLVMNRVVDGVWRPNYPKPESEKTALRAVIAAIDADILALQEMGDEPFLRELQRDLANEGLDYPHAHVLRGPDEVRHVAVLSRLPFREVVERVDLDFPYFGERETIKRGLLEIGFTTGGLDWSLFVVHLKSRWTERDDDPNAVRRRTGEATAARNAILAEHDPEAGALFLVAGDFNDTTDTGPLRRFYQRGDVTITELLPTTDSRGHTWTHFWARQNLYSRVDYLLPSPALAKWIKNRRAYIYDTPEVEKAGDHRPVWLDLEFPLPRSSGEGRVAR